MSVAREIEHAVRKHANWYQNKLFPEAPVRISTGMQHSQWMGDYEGFTDYFADFMCVTPSGYATELEVKLSRADWRVDLQKPKWVEGRFPPWISRFIYVVPEKLGIPEWVPGIAGVWHVRGQWIKTARAPKRVGKEKVPPKQLDYWMKNMYYRYWRLRVDLEERDVQAAMRKKAAEHDALMELER